MYSVLLAIQIMADVLLFFCLLKVARVKGFASARYLLLSSSAVVIYAVGYTLEMLSRTMAEARICLSFEYFGLSISALLFYLFVSEYCNMGRFKNWVIWAILCFDILIMISVFTNRLHKFYYSSFDFVFTGLFPHVETGKGPLYWAFAVYQIMMLNVCCFKFYKLYRVKRKSQDKKLYMILVVESLFPIIGIAANVLSWLEGFDMGPMMTSIMMSGLILTLTNGRLYDISDIAFKKMFQNVSNGIIVADEDCKYYDSNDIAKSWFEELNTLKRGTNLNSVDARICDSMADSYFDVNGRYFTSHSTKLYDHEKHVGYIITISDVTEMRNRLNEMEELKEEAEASNRAKSNFLANMSHEIRTPLNAIIGMAQLSKKENSQDAIREYVDQIEAAGQMLLGIVSDVLDISRAESGKLELVPVDYSLRELFSSVINITNMRIGDKPLKLYVDINPQMPAMLNGDDIRIKQILMNFLSNAEKYTDSGFVKLVGDFEIFGEICVLKFSVTDTGRGILDEDKDKLFKPFSQVDMKRNRKVTGSGLGLSIASTLIKLMDGTYGVESEYGQGSTFSFTIKQRIVDAKPISEDERTCVEVAKSTSFMLYRKETEVSKDNEKEEKLPSFPDAKVLVVDDNRVNVKVLCAFLKRYSIVADTCYSGKEALEKTKNTPYDVIFMDHMMPDMDGVETTKKIRNDFENVNRKSTIIACTANVVKGVEELFIKSGLNDFVPKPLQLEVLTDKLSKYLS